ncbi:MAG TPA: DUF883 family protein [Gammaproteobacteria bacterium]
MTHKVSTEQLIEDLSTVIRDAEDLLRATASQTGDKIEEARARAERSVREARERLAGLEEEALRRAEALAEDADRYVRANPWRAVGIAAGVALLLGLLLNRR